MRVPSFHANNLGDALETAAQSPTARTAARADKAKASLLATIEAGLNAPPRSTEPKRRAARAPRPPRTESASSLAQQIDGLTDQTIGFLVAGLPDATAASVSEWRTRFANWVAANPGHKDWRAAWAAFQAANQPNPIAGPVAVPAPPVNVVPVQFTPEPAPTSVDVLGSLTAEVPSPNQEFRSAHNGLPPWMRRRTTPALIAPSA